MTGHLGSTGMTPAMAAATATGAPIVELVDIRRTYRLGARELPVLKGIDLGIARGEFVALMGPSGSGKTTLMHIIGCLDRPDGGSYKLAGEEVSGLDDDRLARLRGRQVGFVFQFFNLIPQMTVTENVELPMLYLGVGAAERRRRALAALERVGLKDRVTHHPAQMSGGEMQRGAIARALVCEPSLLVADEPTGNLDSRTGAEIIGLFQELNALGLTVIMVTHDHGVAAKAQRVVRMLDGSLVASQARDQAEAGS